MLKALFGTWAIGGQSQVIPGREGRWLDEYRYKLKEAKIEGTFTELNPEKGIYVLNTAAAIYSREILELF